MLVSDLIWFWYGKFACIGFGALFVIGEFALYQFRGNSLPSQHMAPLWIPGARPTVVQAEGRLHNGAMYGDGDEVPQDWYSANSPVSNTGPNPIQANLPKQHYAEALTKQKLE
mgnify:CR=1 FL=1